MMPIEATDLIFIFKTILSVQTLSGTMIEISKTDGGCTVKKSADAHSREILKQITNWSRNPDPDTRQCRTKNPPAPRKVKPSRAS
jgi:hypothetical protein